MCSVYTNKIEIFSKIINLFFEKPVKQMRDQNNSSIRLLTLTFNSQFLHISGFSREKMGQHSGIKLQSLCEKKYKDNCLNGECYYLVDEDLVGCNCT